jgi:hypothetical protein
MTPNQSKQEVGGSSQVVEVEMGARGSKLVVGVRNGSQPAAGAGDDSQQVAGGGDSLHLVEGARNSLQWA